MAFFRPGTRLADDVRTLGALSGAGSGTAGLVLGREFSVTLGVALFFAFFAALPGGPAVQRAVFDADSFLPRQLVLVPAALVLLVVCLAAAAWSPFSPFVYFRF